MKPVRKSVGYVIFAVITVVFVFMNAYVSAVTNTPALLISFMVVWAVIGQVILRRIAKSENPK